MWQACMGQGIQGSKYSSNFQKHSFKQLYQHT
jgi:hypothetical protein